MRKKKKDEEEEEEKSKKLVKVSTTLASIESLTFPLVQEVVLLADFGCKRCEDRVAGIVSRFNGEMESLEIMMMDKKVIFTFTGKYSREIKTHGKKLEVATVYKNMVKKISNFKHFLLASIT